MVAAAARLPVTTAAATLLAHERTLPVGPAFQQLLPERGLVRGRVVATEGPAAWSLALGLVAAATQVGSWLAVAGTHDLGWTAAAEHGVALERTVVVGAAGGRLDPDVLAALVDGFELVLVPAGLALPGSLARRLQHRLPTRGAVLVVVGGSGPFTADLSLVAREAAWRGIEPDGAGCLRERPVRVVRSGRRAGAPAEATLWLPRPEGEEPLWVPSASA